MTKTFFDYLKDIPYRSLRFSSKESVVDIDQHIDSIFVVKSGMVHLVRYNENGNVVILQRAGAGAIVAEASVFFKTYHCAAITVTKTVIWSYSVRSIRKLLAESPECAQAYARNLANEVREARKRAEILALKTVSERLSAWLTWNHGVLPIKGAWHHVADEIGISKEALYRELSKRRKLEE